MQNLTRLDYYSIGRSYVRTRAKRIDPAQIDVAGSDINLFVGSTSYMTFAAQRQMDERLNALFLDGCLGEDLDRWGFDRYRLLRKGASAARTDFVCERPTVVGGVGQIAVGQKFKTKSGIEYLTLQPANFTALTKTVTIKARAVSAGKDYQVGANNIWTPSAGALFDPSIRVVNPSTAAGGEPREQDDVFRERIRGFWEAMSRGTLGAIQYGALTVPGVSSAVAFEVQQDGHGARLVQLYIADSSGVSTRGLLDVVAVVLDDWSGAGVYVLLTNGTPQMIDGIQLALTFRTGVDTVSLAAEIQSTVVEYVNSLGIGQPLYHHDLGAVLARFAADGLIPTQDTIRSPVGDIMPSSNGMTLRIQPSNVTIVN